VDGPVVDPTLDRLFPVVYDELRRLAARLRPTDSVTPTLLVHEAWLKLQGLPAAEPWEPRRLRVVVAAAMRSVLVDLARRRRAVKRGGGQERVTLSGVGEGTDPVDVLALHAALSRLEREDEATYRIIELRFFGGLSNVEVAETLGISLRTVERNGRAGQAALRMMLGEPSLAKEADE
jgi:RNA polymerase sigma factor (TIGR02999 family)